MSRIKTFCKTQGISVDFYISQIENGFKRCFRCKEWRSVNEFAIDKSRYDGKKAACFVCCRVKERVVTKGRVSSFKGKKHSKKAIEIFKKINKSSGNPNWKGGVTNLIGQIRNSGAYKDWRASVCKLGNSTCSICGVKKESGGVQFHSDHIISIAQSMAINNITTIQDAMLCKEIFDPNNGRLLCKPCHIKTDTWGVTQSKYKKDTEAT